MNIRKTSIKALFIVTALLSILLSLLTTITLFTFLFSPKSKDLLLFFIFSLLLTTISWGATFFITSLNKEKSKKERWNEIKELVVKLPLILASSIITSIYTLLYFFFFAFLTVSKYGKGGLGGSASEITLISVFVILGIAIFGVVMYKVFKTDKQDISLTLYNQFSTLKWSSLIILPFGIWASYYFYSTEGSAAAWIAMSFWSFIFYSIYKIFSKLSDKVHNQITNANVNRILHEKKKKIINKSNSSNKNQTPTSIADELKKLKELLDQGIISSEEFNIQKKKLLN